MMPLPQNMPHPTSPEYQQFLNAYFTGKVQGAEKHNWTTELGLCQDPRGAEKQSKDPALSVWQALGYIHARKVIESNEMHGSLFWWTPGSGKSIMVSLLLELLYDTDRPIYVVSTPQNTRQNGLKECVRAMLRFSPRFNVSDREPTVEDEENLLRLFRKRKPPVFMGNFMTFRVFTSKCMQKPSMLEGAAVIIDESHELFNPKVCERHNMWEHVLERLCNDAKSKVFTFSGTPGRNMREVLLQVELVRFAHERTSLASLERGEGWRDRVAAYTRGRVSYVDGAMDRSRFPVNMTHETVKCELSEQQFINVGDRSHKLLTNLQFSGFKEMVDAVSDEKTRKTALPSMRLAQVAATCFWGRKINGLRAELSLIEMRKAYKKDVEDGIADGNNNDAENQEDQEMVDADDMMPEGPKRPDHLGVELVEQFAPKYAALIRHIMDIPIEYRTQKKHFIYSCCQHPITHLSTILEMIELEVSTYGLKNPFKQLHATDLQWVTQEDGKTMLKLADNMTMEQILDFPEQLVFVCLTGNSYKKEDRDKVMAAFGRVTPDGRRFEGLRICVRVRLCISDVYCVRMYMHVHTPLTCIPEQASSDPRAFPLCSWCSDHARPTKD